MNCKEFKNKLPDYFDQRLNADLKNQFNEHLHNCAECSLLFDKMSSTLSLLDNPHRIPEQPYFFTQLKQKMESRLVKNESLIHSILTKKVLQPVLYLASLIIAVYIGILVGSGTTGNQQYAEKTKPDTSYIEVLAQFQYINEMELESIEKNLVSNESFDTNNED